MIICICGGVGTGKSITAIHYLFSACKADGILTNFNVKNNKNVYRLKREDVIQEQSTIPEGCKKPVTKKSVNWDFWAEHRNCDVFLDEVHNLISSRNSMSTSNRVFSEWVSQIRKVWSQSGDTNLIETIKRLDNTIFNKIWTEALSRSRNLYYISQTERKTDINFRELTQVLIRCRKIIIDNKTIIINYIWFAGDYGDAFEAELLGIKPKIHVFLADKYFSKYDSYEIIRSQGEYL